MCPKTSVITPYGAFILIAAGIYGFNLCIPHKEFLTNRYLEEKPHIVPFVSP